MNVLCCFLWAVLSVWDYPSRQTRHEELRAQFLAAGRKGDLAARAEACRKGVELLPDDPTWRYNLACSLALEGKADSALDELEKAIDLGFRDADTIAGDADFVKVAGVPRFNELVEDARKSANRPILLGPGAIVPATGLAGKPLALGAHNLVWDLDAGCFDAKINLLPSGGVFDGFLYMNRDGRHSMLTVTNYPGLTPVSLDQEGREHCLDQDFPNMVFPLPLFGNCSKGMTKERNPVYWRSLPRAMMTGEAHKMPLYHRFYRSNQVWVFPAVDDYNFTSTNFYGDVFASVAPYWIVTQGRSWSDQYYLRAALDATRAMRPEARAEIVRRGLLAPTIQTLFRRSLRGVGSDADYLSPRAHPTAFPPNGLDLGGLKKRAAALRADRLPPVATIAGVRAGMVMAPSKVPELTYLTPCAWAFVLRSPDVVRSFIVQAAGGAEYAFAAVHDERGAAKVTKLGPDVARITLDREKMSVTNRVDLAVFARNPSTDWGAPAFVSFAVVDPSAPYSDPVLTPREDASENREDK